MPEQDERHGVVFHQAGERLILFSIILNFMNRETNIVETLLLRLLADENKLLAVRIWQADEAARREPR